MSLVGNTLSNARLALTDDSGTVDLGEVCKGPAKVSGFASNLQDRDGGVSILTLTISVKEEAD